MKTLVTGADGLLGSNLVRELVGCGFNVRAFIHPASKSNTLEGLCIERYQGDILDRSSLERAMRGCEGVFHCAASTALWPPRDPRITAVNLDGTRNVIDAAEQCKVGRVVHVGTANSFGFGPKDRPGTEESPYSYWKYRLAYCDSKHEAQNLVLERVKQKRMDAVIVNPTFMLGPCDFGPSSGKMIVGFVKLKPKMYPPGGRNFVHVRDVAKGMISALERGRSGECYIAGHQNMSMGELFAAIGRVTGVAPPKLRMPEWVVVPAGLVGSFVAAMTRKPPNLSYELARISCVGTYYSAEKATRELELPQTPVETAIKEAYDWFVDHRYIQLDR